MTKHSTHHNTKQNMIPDGKGGAKSLASSEEGAITSTGAIGKHGKSKVVYDGPLRAV